MFAQKPSGSPANRQKIIIGVIAVCLILVLWQIKGMFGGGGKAAAPAAMPQAQQMQAKPANAPPGQLAPMPQPPGSAPNQPAAPAQPQISEAPVPKEVTGILMTQQQMQQRYLESLNELQMLRLQKDLIEMKGAIASAELAKATTEKNLENLLNPPPPPPPPPARPVNPYVTGGPPGLEQPVDIWTQYKVLSVVSDESGKWSAVVGFKDSTFVVNVGDILPPDGSQVVNISKQGIVIENAGKSKRIDIVSQI